ncbi:hypothetical protein CF319_g7050 [Tilletia indica]|nr:hypothetical protein CF319_g7050 [Tilletia indica]
MNTDQATASAAASVSTTFNIGTVHAHFFNAGTSNAPSAPSKATSSSGPSAPSKKATSSSAPRVWVKRHAPLLNSSIDQVDALAATLKKQTGASMSAVRQQLLLKATNRRKQTAWNLILHLLATYPVGSDKDSTDKTGESESETTDKTGEPESENSLTDEADQFSKAVQKSVHKVWTTFNVPGREKDQAWNTYIGTVVQPFWNKEKTTNPSNFKAMVADIENIRTVRVPTLSAVQSVTTMRQESKWTAKKASDLEENHAIAAITILVHPDPQVEPRIITTDYGKKVMQHVMTLWRPEDDINKLLERINTTVGAIPPSSYALPAPKDRTLDTPAPQADPTPEIEVNTPSSIPDPQATLPTSTGAISRPLTHAERIPVVARQLLRLITTTLHQQVDSPLGQLRYDHWMRTSASSSSLPYRDLFTILRSYRLLVDGWPKAAAGLLLNPFTAESDVEGALEIFTGGLLDTSAWLDHQVTAIAASIADGTLKLDVLPPQ